MKFTRSLIIRSFKPIVNIIILATVSIATFKLGIIYSKSNEANIKQPNPYAHAFSPEEISIAVNESNELIMIERATGKYIVYSDKIGQTIFGMYANRIHQEVNASK